MLTNEGLIEIIRGKLVLGLPMEFNPGGMSGLASEVLREHGNEAHHKFVYEADACSATMLSDGSVEIKEQVLVRGEASDSHHTRKFRLNWTLRPNTERTSNNALQL